MEPAQQLKALRDDHPDIEVLAPSDGGWEERRATRGQAGQERKPLGIAMPKDAAQVARIVRWAKSQQVEVTVRSGGNDFFGRNVVDNGLIIDMRSLDFINVADDRKSATIGGGVITEHLIRRFEEEGVIAPCGNAWIVGYVGWATLGGYGPLTNLFGMGFEGIVAAQVVTSEGDVVDAPADLLEGIRGAGGNFGIITALTIKVYPARKFLSGMLMLEATPENAKAVVAAEAKLDIPNCLTLHHLVVTAKARMIGIMFTWSDPDHEKGQDFLRLYMDTLPPVRVNTVALKSPIEHMSQIPMKLLPWGGQRSVYVTSMSPKVLDLLMEAAQTMPADVNIGWTMDTVIDHDTCVPNCFGAANHIFVAFSDMTAEESQLAEAVAWNNTLYNKLRECGDAAMMEGSYAPLTRPEDRTAEQLFGNKWARVKELKAKYDPDNFFKNAVPKIPL